MDRSPAIKDSPRSEDALNEDVPENALETEGVKKKMHDNQVIGISKKKNSVLSQQVSRPRFI